MSSPVVRRRTRLRWLHLGVGLALGTYVYLPPGTAEWLRWALMLVGVPAVTLSGLLMWRPAALRQLLARRVDGAQL